MIRDLQTINEYAQSGQMPKLIEMAEAEFEQQVNDVADFCKAGLSNKRVVLIAGPSSSGKTTFALKLAKRLEQLGMESYKVSLDDFYFDRDQMPRDEDNQIDFETVEALDLRALKNSFDCLHADGYCEIPHFSFQRGLHTDEKSVIRMHHNTIILVEGMHALNDLIAETVGNDRATKIYISLLGDLQLEGRAYLDKRTLRLMRRLVRDYQYRGSSAENTFSMWDGVLEGDIKYVKPFECRANLTVDSFFPYDAGVLKNILLPLLDDVTDGSSFASKRDLLRRKLSLVMPVDVSLLPPTSLLREFAGNSIYY